MSNENNVFVLSDGRKLGYAEYGDPKGKPLFYFHGWPSSRYRGSETDTIAKKLHVRLISIDRPGYGLSTFKSKRTLLDWADDVGELADHLQLKKFAVEGVSGGGPYAAAVAYKIPERLTKVGIVVGLGPTYLPGILDGIPWTAKIGWANYAKLPLLAYLGSLYQYIEGKYFSGIFTFQFRAKVDKELIKKEKKEFMDKRDEAFRQGIQGAVHDLLLYSSDWGFDVRKIRAKVYLWYGGADKQVTLHMAKYFSSRIKGSIVKIYPNEGHLVQKTHMEEIFKTLTR